ncbi:hypothetical protein RJ639_023302 [Escallonia herrerae]|uniref:Glycosyltransferase family 92 protein n=1 Tax=Escallonia herrerae TaxID=1293975 RepID=A0AA88V0H1_9ASTE|nr:hypothetical protein RJ639_023302 [Escallonia herrerae]
MAGLPLRPQPPTSFASKLLLLLTILPITLALLAFLLQWRGGDVNDPISRWSPEEGSHKFPAGMDASPLPQSDCATLPHSSSPSFPYYRDSNFTSEFHLTPKGVRVIYRTKELEEQQAKSRIWNETWLSSFFYKPCNYELFVKQSLNMEMAIVMARELGMDWIIHLDTDELLHPAGAREYSLRQLLLDVPGNVDMVVFPNYESSVERDDIKDPFTEVSMFKKNYDHLPKDTYFGLYKESTRGNPNYFLTYGNGKSAARVRDHLRPNGAHRWHNYMKTPNEIKLEEAAVLHYTYAKFSDLTSRRDRCGCKPTKEDVKRCFMLEFDRAAFIIASTATEEEMLSWYREHVVWTDNTVNLKLLRKGILSRIYAPMDGQAELLVVIMTWKWMGEEGGGGRPKRCDRNIFRLMARGTVRRLSDCRVMWEAIVQGLRESGVFSSVIASAQARLSKDKFFASIESSNSSRAAASESLPSRKIGRSKESRAIARKALGVAATTSHEAAVPPLSPPGIDGRDLITES